MWRRLTHHCVRAGLAALEVAIALFARLEATISKDQKPIRRADVPAGAGKTDPSRGQASSIPRTVKHHTATS